MYFHGSPIGGIENLQPNVSILRGEDTARIYLSSQEANAAIYCTKCHMYPYGFDKESGLLQYDEPYEECLKDLYAKRSGYLYMVEEHESIVPMKDIRNGYTSDKPIRVQGIEFIEDIYDKLLEYEDQGEILLVRFKDVPQRTRDFYHNWVAKTLAKEKYFNSSREYPTFLKNKFPLAWEKARSNRDQLRED